MYVNSITELASILAKRAEAVARHLFPKGVKNGDEWCVGNIVGAPGRSLKIHLRGPKAGVWMDFDNPADTGDLVELWTRARGIPKAQAIREISVYLGNSVERRQATLVAIRQDPKPINEEYHRVLKANLQRNESAIAYLTGPKRGLDRTTIEKFGLGLSGLYNGKTGPTKDALIAPMLSFQTGQFLGKLAYFNIPGLTLNPVAENGWMRGNPQTYYAEAKRKHAAVFVCEGLKDVWRHWQALSGASITNDILLITSTHGSAFPNEWMDSEFWKGWNAVWLAQDNDDAGERMAERLAGFVGREARRVRVPVQFGKDWTDFWQNGGTIEAFQKLLDESPAASVTKILSPATTAAQTCADLKLGRFSYTPVDINGAFENGHLYYPTKTHSIDRDPKTGAVVERLETIVIRSDRTVHYAIYATPPVGTPQTDRVLKLTDGTLIEKEPKVSPHHTWSWESIQRYLDGKGNSRPLADIFNDIILALKQAVWLPNDEDFTVLALAVPVTYLHYVFSAVPLFLLNGPMGSGKTQIGNAMAEMCANSAVVGQISAATAARLIDETRGFIVLDDVESIAAKAGKDAQITELIQHLKVSYNKKTAKKTWTDIKTMKPETLDFYGVKMLSSTLGADPILNSRMIRIQTRQMPDYVKSTVRDYTPEDLDALHELRNELHTWAFENVNRVKKTYQEVYASKTDRRAEIAAPLRTGALSGVFALVVNGDRGRNSLLDLCEDDWDWLFTLRTQAGSKRYIFFAWPQGRRLSPDRIPLGEGIFLLGEGDWLLFPPSHEPGGVQHVFLTRSAAAQAPPWLFNIAFCPETALDSTSIVRPDAVQCDQKLIFGEERTHGSGAPLEL